MIPRHTIEQILNRADIVEVVSDFVTLHKRGADYKGLCPFHNEKSPSFSVSPARQMCKCFSCGKGGNAVHFLMELQGMSFVEAIKHLGQKYGIEVLEKEQTDEERQATSLRESLYIINDFARDFFTQALHHTPDGQSIGMAYFRQRGFRDDIIAKFQLGFSPNEWEALSKEAQRKGYAEELLLKTGLCYKTEKGGVYDRFHGRVIFPVHALSGKVVAFGGRTLSTDKKQAKYVNSPESDIYSKSNELYGVYYARNAIRKTDKCFLVEGYTDVISMHQAGIENVVASSGTSLTTGQIRMIHRLTRNITVIYDGDAAGIKASLRGIDMLLEEGMNIKVMLLPDGEDPDSFARSHTAEELAAYISEYETDFLRFKTKLLLRDVGNDPLKRVALITDVVQSISLIPEAIARAVFIKDCSLLLGMEEQLLLREVNRRIHDRINERERQRALGAQTRRDGASRADIPSGTAAAAGTASSQPTNTNSRTAPNTTSGTEQRAENQPILPSIPPPAIPNPAIPTTQPLPTSVPTSSHFNRVLEVERLIVQQIISEGAAVAYIDEQGQQLTVGELFNFLLRREEFIFRTEVHHAILCDFMAHIKEGNFVPARYFVQHYEMPISRLAVELLNELPTLSRRFVRPSGNEEEVLRMHYETVLRLFHDYMNAILTEQLTILNTQLRTLDGDSPEVLSIMQQIKDLQATQRDLSKHVGDRVVLHL